MKRAKNASDGEQNVDRLSALPDCVICDILSFLPIKRSVQTSVLAKRWRSLWAHVPVLDLQGEAGTSYTIFPRFVCKVLLQHKAPTLNTFRLICPDDEYDDDDDDDDDDDCDDDDDDCDDSTMGCDKLKRCITTVVDRNVQNLYLSLRVEVPSCLLTCKSLIDLTLYNVGVSIPPSAPIYLPNLKKLHLWYLKCKVDFTRLLSGCPVLEEFFFDRIMCGDPGDYYISSPTLKSLTIILLLENNCMHRNPDNMVKINTPALSYLKVRDNSSKNISISPCTSLVEADICFDYNGREPDDFDRRCVLKFLDSIRNIKCLSISGFYCKIWDGPMPCSFEKFDNLTKLKVPPRRFLLSKFLESVDHLQVLTIYEDDCNPKQWKDPDEEPSACLLHSLRTVRIDVFRCSEHDFDMVRYILRNALVLERMEIKIYRARCSDVGLKQKSDAIRRISLFDRGSVGCELAFS